VLPSMRCGRPEHPQDPRARYGRAEHRARCSQRKSLMEVSWRETMIRE
jgi:hypothetical protein